MKQEYLNRINQTLLDHSTVAIFAEAVLEWSYQGKNRTITLEDGHCELCGNTNLIYLFTIVNAKNNAILEVGSECINNYNINGARWAERDKTDMQKAVKKGKDLALLTQAALVSPWIADKLEGWTDGIQRYGKLTPKQMQVVKKALSKAQVAS
jgi:hypothetical protein